MASAARGFEGEYNGAVFVFEAANGDGDRKALFESEHLPGGWPDDDLASSTEAIRHLEGFRDQVESRGWVVQPGRPDPWYRLAFRKAGTRASSGPSPTAGAKAPGEGPRAGLHPVSPTRAIGPSRTAADVAKAVAQKTVERPKPSAIDPTTIPQHLPTMHVELQPLRPLASQLEGHEAIVPGSTVRDFWAWAFGDLRHGVYLDLLARFMVARALGEDPQRRCRPDDRTVVSADGTRVSVSATSRHPDWPSCGPSHVRFERPVGIGRVGQVQGEPSHRSPADIVVVALHTAADPAAFDPLNLADWAYYVLPMSIVQKLPKGSIPVAVLIAVAPPPVIWSKLPVAIDGARTEPRGCGTTT